MNAELVTPLTLSRLKVGPLPTARPKHKPQFSLPQGVGTSGDSAVGQERRNRSSPAWGTPPDASGTRFPGSRQTWVPGAPHDTAEPRPRPGPWARRPNSRPCCFPPDEPVVLGPSEEHGEDKKRQRWIGGVFKGHTTPSSTLVNHTATAPRSLLPSARAHATFMARLPGLPSIG